MIISETPLYFAYSFLPYFWQWQYDVKKKNNFSKHSIRLDEIIQSGIVNSIRISSDFQVIAAAVAQENRTGRWMVNKAWSTFFSKWKFRFQNL